MIAYPLAAGTMIDTIKANKRQVLSFLITLFISTPSLSDTFEVMTYKSNNQNRNPPLLIVIALYQFAKVIGACHREQSNIDILAEAGMLPPFLLLSDANKLGKMI